MHCLVQPRDQIIVKGQDFASFAKNMGKNIDKNISKNLSGKYSQTLFDPAKQSAEMHLKLLQKKSNSKNSRSNW